LEDQVTPKGISEKAVAGANSIGKVKENHLTIFEMGVLFYLENFGLREMPKEKKANLMGNRIEAAERKLKALGYIKG
jgi:hypothetical protein